MTCLSGSYTQGKYVPQDDARLAAESRDDMSDSDDGQFGDYLDYHDHASYHNMFHRHLLIKEYATVNIFLFGLFFDPVLQTIC
jgi:hypothetical protein